MTRKYIQVSEIGLQHYKLHWLSIITMLLSLSFLIRESPHPNINFAWGLAKTHAYSVTNRLNTILVLRTILQTGIKGSQIFSYAILAYCWFLKNIQASNPTNWNTLKLDWSPCQKVLTKHFPTLKSPQVTPCAKKVSSQNISGRKDSNHICFKMWVLGKTISSNYKEVRHQSIK